jgi:hypothetical protein
MWSPPPEVHYSSYGEYKEFLARCVDGLSDMAAASINITAVDEFGMGFSVDKEEWPFLGVACLFRLTKQCGFPWCETINDTIADAILQNSTTAFFQTDTHGDIFQMLFILRDVARQTVSHLLGIGGLGLYSMNFVDLVGHDPVTKAKWREHQVAVMMALHPRLGPESRLSWLDQDLLKAILLSK